MVKQSMANQQTCAGDARPAAGGCCGPPEHAPRGLKWLGAERAELLFAALAALFLVIAWVVSFWSMVPRSVWIGLYLTSCVFGGYFATIGAWKSLRRGRFQIDFLMIVAAAGAAQLGHWFEGALLLSLFSAGHAMEHYALGRARKSVAALGQLRPKTAIVDRDGREVEVPVGQLRVGDRVVVRPDSAIAADGVVIAGESSVDQAAITGESMPVEKSPAPDFDPQLPDPQHSESQVPGATHDRQSLVGREHRVFAGTMNGSGELRVYVTRAAEDTTLARVMRLVTEAESQRSPAQRLADRFERYFVPAVLVGVVILLFAFLVLDEPFSASFYRAMAVLVGASPCALAIATPSAVLSAVARGGRSGVLFKGGGPLELLGQVQAIAFDKTGTLTIGKPALTDVEPAEGISPERLLTTAAAVERLSPHPLARAVVAASRERFPQHEPLKAHGLRSITGRGIEAQLEGRQVSVGTLELFAQSPSGPVAGPVLETVTRLEQSGRTTMIVRDGEQYLGVLGLMDTPREAAQRSIERLRQMGLKHLIMLSGDNPTVVKQIANTFGLDDARGDLMPEDKVTAIRQLNETWTTAMVGDGVNDAPAMAAAAVAVAMGAAGSDVALETADVALMGDDLTRLPFALALSRQTSRIIRQNLWISLGVVAVLIPAALAGLNLAAAVVFHEGSTVVVVLNSLRLLAFREPNSAGNA